MHLLKCVGYLLNIELNFVRVCARQESIVGFGRNGYRCSFAIYGRLTVDITRDVYQFFNQ